MIDPETIRCREVVELLSDYLEGALTEDERAGIEEHLAACEGCSNVLQQLRETIRITGRLTEDEITEPERTALLDAFRGWRRGSAEPAS